VDTVPGGITAGAGFLARSVSVGLAAFGKELAVA